MHGVKRVRRSPEALEAKRVQDQQRLAKYLALQDDVLSRKGRQDYSLDALKLTTSLLSENPEFYTIWNYRRLILQNGLFPGMSGKAKKDALEDDLTLTLTALKSFPKVYWIWNHRTWCLQTMPDEQDWLEVSWNRELGFVEKMLNADPRNCEPPSFRGLYTDLSILVHAWEYRRLVLESHPTPPSLANEIKYTNVKISANFSNFSAWHQRSKVLPQFWGSGEHDEQKYREDGQSVIGIFHSSLIIVRETLNYFVTPCGQTRMTRVYGSTIAGSWAQVS